MDEECSVVEFEELCYFCMINIVGDFIFNDIKFGGDEVRFNFLIGVNVVGKLIVLCMVCWLKFFYVCIRLLIICSFVLWLLWFRLVVMFL